MSFHKAALPVGWETGGGHIFMGTREGVSKNEMKRGKGNRKVHITSNALSGSSLPGCGTPFQMT